MIEISSLLWVWNTRAAGRWYFLTIPPAEAALLRATALATPRGFGSVRVKATIGAVSWRTSVFPQDSGGYLLPVKADVRKRTAVAVGDQVIATIEILN